MTVELALALAPLIAYGIAMIGIIVLIIIKVIRNR